MKYKAVEFPFEVTDFKKLTGRQAKAFFQHYIDYIPERIQVLKDYMSYEGYEVEFDFTPESLIPIWEWYESKIKVKKIAKKELEKRAQRYPKWMRRFVLEENKEAVTGDVYFWDVAIYFAEVVRENNAEKLKWVYKTSPKNYISVNKPVLQGFRGGLMLDSNLVVLNLTDEVFEGKDKYRLYNLYKVWQSFVD